ncbi:MAG: 16S rRNA (uracil(1498)-N(3))-methyltransferase [Lachnospiraceae bacterium]|nr:16S rRNA (uracil(1498)-N(3))-methyltransferase [Lachnospiraceae bacterium]
MNHFFVDPAQISGTEIRITGEDVNHIRNVLRMRPGEEISVSNGTDDKEYRCGIEKITEDEVICSLRFIKENAVELPVRITLFQGLPKADKMELIVQKTVELGVSEIVPVSMERCVVQLDAKKYAKKQERWQAIAEAAAKQSRRGRIPQIAPLMNLGEALSLASQMELAVIPYELAEGMEATRAFMQRLCEVAKMGGEPRLGIFIGPEGGFSREEVSRAEQAGAQPISLGRRILRTETAGMALLAMIGYQLES